MELKPCPFCGGEATLTKDEECSGHGMCVERVFVECMDCGAGGPIFDDWRHKKDKMTYDAINAWNERIFNKGEEKMKYIYEQVKEPLILEPEDYPGDEWSTILKIFGMEEAERIVISDYTFEAYGKQKEKGEEK